MLPPGDIRRQYRMRLPSGLFLVLLLAACADPPEIKKARADMTQRERDSTIANSILPGAGVVKRAMKTADAQAERAAAYEAIATQ